MKQLILLTAVTLIVSAQVPTAPVPKPTVKKAVPAPKKAPEAAAPVQVAPVRTEDQQHIDEVITLLQAQMGEPIILVRLEASAKP